MALEWSWFKSWTPTQAIRITLPGDKVKLKKPNVLKQQPWSPITTNTVLKHQLHAGDVFTVVKVEAHEVLVQLDVAESTGVYVWLALQDVSKA